MNSKTILCPKCNGSGDIVKIDPLFAVFTLGITALMDMGTPDRCHIYKGSGIDPRS